MYSSVLKMRTPKQFPQQNRPQFQDSILYDCLLLENILVRLMNLETMFKI
jgi:hypothetical protein